MEIAKYLTDLKQIEKILLTCYSRHGKSALIQSKLQQVSGEKVTFIVTNDAVAILNSMSFYDNQILVMLIETIRKHSKENGDNCKTLFVYVLTILTYLFESNNNQEEIQKVISFLRFSNLAFVYEEFLKEWNANCAQFSGQMLKVTSTQDFMDILPKLSVLNNLNGLNKSLSNISSNIIVNLICRYVENERTQLAEIPSILRQLLDDLDYTLIYSDQNTLSSTRLFENGFLLNYRVLLDNFSRHTIHNAIFLLVKNESETLETNAVSIQIDSNFQEKILDSFYAEKKNVFSNFFLDSLLSSKINVILTSSCLSELQKSQLNSMNISLISYIDLSSIRFICHRVGVQPIEIETICSASFGQQQLIENSLALESIENVENDKLTFFKFSKKLNLNFIYFCSPIKLQFAQFKAHLAKVIKTVLNNFEEINLIDPSANQTLRNLFIETSFFEMNSLKILQNLKNSNINNIESFLFYKNLIKIFECVNLKMNNSIRLTVNREDSDFVYEPISLKFSCFIKSLYFIQSLLKIDKIFFIKKKTLSKN